MKFANTTRVLIGAVLLCGASLASASPLDWQLSGVAFDDGTSASGTLRYDAASDTLLSYSIAVQDGALADFTYTAASSIGCARIAHGNDGATGCNTNDAPNELFLGSSDGYRFLSLYLSSALTDAGGVVALLMSGNTQSYEIDGDYDFRAVSGGSLVAVADANVPEPASLSLMGIAVSGMLGVAGLRGQRKQ